MASSESPSANDARRVKDVFSLVFVVMMLHGIGNLLPWNMFINAKEYFEDHKLMTNSSANADYRVNFMNYIGVASQLPNMLMSAFNVFFQPVTVSKVSGSALRRIAVVVAVEILVCLLTVVLAVVDTSDTPKFFFAVTILSVVVLNCCTAVYQSSTFGLAALLPMKYSNAVVLGNNVCGTVIAIANIVCKALSTQNLQLTAICYFSFAILLLLLCLLSVLLLPRLKFYRQHQPRAVRRQRPLMEEAPCDIKMEKEEENEREEEESAEDEACCSETVATATQCFAICCIWSGDSTDACRRYWHRFWHAFTDSWQQCFSVWCVFFCSLACFPAIQSSIRPLQLTRMSAWFTDVFVFLTFNLFAMLGNAASNFVQLVPPKWLLAVVSVRAAVCIPFFLLCNCFPEQRADWLPVLISNDFVFLAGMIVFSFSSGYFSSLCMMYAPRGVRSPELAGLAAMVATFFLVCGIFSGITFGGILFNIAMRA